MTPQQFTASVHPSATDRCDRAIVAVAAGARSIDRTWHQLRAWRPSLEQWQAFAAACRDRGRSTYTARWARHQWLCWSELSDAGTYPEQRANWAAKQAAFEQAMAAKAGRSLTKVKTNAQLRAAARPPAPPCDHAQLALFA